MTSNETYERALQDCFGVKESKGFSTRSIAKTTLSVTQISCDTANNGISNPLPAEDALLVTVQLQDCPEHELWVGGTPMKTAPLSAGMMSIYDLRSDPRVNSVSPFRNMHFHIPLATLSAISEFDGRGAIASFAHQPGVGRDDPIIRGLSFALQPAFDRPTQANALFIDHVTQAVAGHVAYLFSSRNNGSDMPTSRLGAREERIVKDEIDAGIDGNLTLDALGRTIDRPGREMERAFLDTTGHHPHEWLLERRIDRASDLLRRSDLSLVAVAKACGFADVGHMRRLFRRLRGVAPSSFRH